MKNIDRQLNLIGFFSCMLLVLTSGSLGNLINKDKPVHSKAKNFRSFFPDENLAWIVAAKLQKEVGDPVSLKELASIKGNFKVGSEVLDLTGIGYLTGIESLESIKNEITVLPPEIGKLTNLTAIDVVKTPFHTIPPQIGDLPKLKKLRLYLTSIKSLPKEIGNLSNLEILICGPGLTELPKEVGNLKKLRELDIHFNDFTTLPDEICDLTDLTSLDLSSCKLTQLPENIGNLTALKRLNLFANDLKYLPKSIANLANLESLNIYNNYKLSESYKKNLPKLLKNKNKQ